MGSVHRLRSSPSAAASSQFIDIVEGLHPPARSSTRRPGMQRAGDHRRPRQERAPRNPASSSKTGRGPAEYILPTGAFLLVSDGQAGRPRRGISGQDPARDRQDRATSPAVCPAWPSCSRPASPRTRRSSPRSTACVEFAGHHPRPCARSSSSATAATGEGVHDPPRQAPARPRGRPRAGRRPPHRGPHQPERHPDHQGRQRGAGATW